MKKSILGMVLVSAMVCGGLCQSVSADEVLVVGDGTDKITDVTVTIEDDVIDPTDPGETDDFDPTDPNQEDLVLNSVPAAYDFTSALQNSAYTLSTSLTDENITVFNNRSTRKWNVRASVVDDELAISGGTNTVAVTSFTINGEELVGTANGAIVAQNNAMPTPANNTGTIKTAVGAVTIGFSDGDGDLIAGSVLTGEIDYSLYVVDQAD